MSETTNLDMVKMIGRHSLKHNEFKSIENTTDVLNGKVRSRENDKERILVYYYGLAIHDLYFASKIYSMTDDIEDTKYEYCKEKFFV